MQDPFLFHSNMQCCDAEDIGPVKWVNEIVGGCLLILSICAALPIFFSLREDGFDRIYSLSDLYYLLLAFSALCLAGCIYVLVLTPRVGGWVRFRAGGFSIRIVNFIKKGLSLDLDWSDVQKIEVAAGARNYETIAIITADAAPIVFRTDYFSGTADHILSQLFASAEAAHYRLDKDSNVDVLIFKKRAWTVTPKM